MSLVTRLTAFAEAIGLDYKALRTELDEKAESAGLAEVATSGSYNDLSNKPTIPAAPSNMTQAQAESSSNADFRLVSGQRIWQAISKWWSGVSGAFGRTLIRSSTAEAARSELGLGTAATRDVGTNSGNVMEVGAFGLGRAMHNAAPNPTSFGYIIDPDDPMRILGQAGPYMHVSTGARTFTLAARGLRVRIKTWGEQGDPTLELVHSRNLLTSTGQSTEYPMSQLATTTAINNRIQSKTPASATAAGIAGEAAYDSTKMYFCPATNTWREVVSYPVGQAPRVDVNNAYKFAGILGKSANNMPELSATKGTRHTPITGVSVNRIVFTASEILVYYPQNALRAGDVVRIYDHEFTLLGGSSTHKSISNSVVPQYILDFAKEDNYIEVYIPKN